MKFQFALLLFVFPSALFAQIGGPEVVLRQFDDAFTDILNEYDFQKLTEVQAREVGKAMEKKVNPLFDGKKQWTITARVVDVAPGEAKGKYIVRFEKQIAFAGSKADWMMPQHVQLPMSAEAAAKIGQGDYISFTGIPLRESISNTAAKNAEIRKRMNRALAIQFHVIYKEVPLPVVLTDTKMSLPGN